MKLGLENSQLKTYGIPLAAILVIIVLVPLLILPWYNNLTSGLATLDADKTKRTVLEAKATALENLDSQAIKTLLQTQLEPAIPSKGDPSGVLGTLEQLASASGVRTTAATYSSATADTAVAATATETATAATGGEVKVTISIAGEYANIASFITQAETASRVVSVSTLHIAPYNENGELVATFEVYSPYEPIPVDLGPAETPLPTTTAQSEAVLSKIAKLKLAPYIQTDPSNIAGKQNPF